MNYNTDNPIKTKAKDRLNRERLVSSACQAALTITSETSFVIGVKGEWGLGKTSFMNLMIEELETINSKLPSKDACCIVRFNPWMLSDEKQIVQEFFKQISSSLPLEENKKGEMAKGRLANLIDGYRAIISPHLYSAVELCLSTIIPSIGSQIVSSSISYLEKKVLTRVASKFQEPNITLSERKDQISELLATRDSNIIVFIDDMDRLGITEIQLIFKLITLTASFPRIVYVLAYDQEAIETALAKIQGNRGRDYLKKIVQFEIDLPLPDTTSIRNMLNKELLRIDSFIDASKQQDEQERSRFLSLYEKHLLPSLNTPRKVFLFSNTFGHDFERFHDEICPTDLIGITLIKEQYPNIALWLYENRRIATGADFQFLFDQKPCEKTVKGFKSACEKDLVHLEKVRPLVTLVFPNMQKLLTGMTSSSSFSQTKHYALGHISYLGYFELYWCGLPLPAISRSCIDQAIKDGSEKELLDLIELSISSNSFTDLLANIQYKAEVIPKERIPLLAKCLFFSFGKSNETDIAFIFPKNSDDTLAEVIRALFSEIRIEASSNLVEKIISSLSTSNILGMIYFVRDERLAQQDGTQNSICISPDCYAKLCERYTETIDEHLIEILEQGDFKYISLAKALAEDGRNNYQQKIDEITENDPRYKLLYIASRLAIFYRGDEVCFSKEGVDIEFDPSQIINISKTVWFKNLPLPAKAKIAALYIMLTDPNCFGEVKETVATALVKEWLSELAT